MLFFISILFSWESIVVKLSTKNPDLNLFNPLESETKRFAVFVSRRDSDV